MTTTMIGRGALRDRCVITTTKTKTNRKCEMSILNDSRKCSRVSVRRVYSRRRVTTSALNDDDDDGIRRNSLSESVIKSETAPTTTMKKKIDVTRATSRSLGKTDYKPVWETDIEAEFKRKEIAEKEKEREKVQKEATGLGFARVNMLNDMDVDIGEKVREIEERKKREQEEAKTNQKKKLTALDLATTNKTDSKYNLEGWNYAPTKAERARWANEWAKAERAKAAKNPSYRPMSRQMLNRTIKDSDWEMRNQADAKVQETPTEVQLRRRKEDEERLEKSKKDLFTGTIGLCVAGFIGALFAGSNTNILCSWVLGSSGSLLYVRLLSQKADSQGGQGGPPTILVPVVLFMALNRFNALGGTDVTGITLTPIPMLLAFFSYKPASLFQGLRDLVDEQQPQQRSD
jgi:ATP synthase protein I